MQLTRFIYQRGRNCSAPFLNLISGKIGRLCGHAALRQFGKHFGVCHLALGTLARWQLDALHLNLFKTQLPAKTTHTHWNKRGVKCCSSCASVCVCVCVSQKLLPTMAGHWLKQWSGPGYRPRMQADNSAQTMAKTRRGCYSFCNLKACKRRWRRQRRQRLQRRPAAQKVHRQHNANALCCKQRRYSYSNSNSNRNSHSHSNKIWNQRPESQAESERLLLIINWFVFSRFLWQVQ